MSLVRSHARKTDYGPPFHDVGWKPSYPLALCQIYTACRKGCYMSTYVRLWPSKHLIATSHISDRTYNGLSFCLAACRRLCACRLDLPS